MTVVQVLGLTVPAAVVGGLMGAGLGAGLLLVFFGLRGATADPTRPPGRLARLMSQARTPQASARGVAAVVAGAGTLLITRWPVAAVGIAALVVSWQSLFGGSRAEQAAINRLEALVLWTESLRDTVAAHASLERVIPASTRTAPPLMQAPLTRLAGQLHSHMPMDRALQGLANDLNDPSADLVIAALILNTRRRGDQLAGVLSGLAESARQELSTRTRISQGRAGLRRGVQIMVAITIAFAGYLAVFSREYVEPYASVTGQIVLVVVLGMFGAGFAWMRRLAMTPDTARFLATPGTQPSDEEIRLVATLTRSPRTEALRLIGSGTTTPPGPSRAPDDRRGS
ncbi:type II secretion system protein [Kineosporia rhizophila]|uniref:type II secretion system F family protein n=1 Tax=Kineosporia rhizophila TaxID=84633 RepID=UPI000A94ACC1|nr:type II secretion system protein [Kineosporia rhizophila]MCE0536065.1 type II secretion system protein [Kineosporia rhizophila]